MQGFLKKGCSFWVIKSQFTLYLFVLVGGGVITSTGTQYNQTGFQGLSSEKGEVDGGSVWSGTKHGVLSIWGEPDEIITIDDESTKWVYHREFAWHSCIFYCAYSTNYTFW